MYYTFKYLFTSLEARDNALNAAYPTWESDGASTQTLEDGDTIILLGQNFDKTDPENPIPLNEWCVDIVSTEVKSEISSFSVYPNTPDHEVLGISFSPQIQRKSIKIK